MLRNIFLSFFYCIRKTKKRKKTLTFSSDIFLTFKSQSQITIQLFCFQCCSGFPQSKQRSKFFGVKLKLSNFEKKNEQITQNEFISLLYFILTEMNQNQVNRLCIKLIPNTTKNRHTDGFCNLYLK